MLSAPSGIMQVILATLQNKSLLNSKISYGLKKWSKQLSNLNQTITNCSYTLSMLDGIEEQRQLSIIEKNFRKILENHTRKIMEAIKGSIGETGQKSDGLNLVMRTQNSSILLPPKITEEISSHLLSIRMALKSPTMNTKLPLYGALIKIELE
jgi:hypothetical protein